MSATDLTWLKWVSNSSLETFPCCNFVMNHLLSSILKNKQRKSIASLLISSHQSCGWNPTLAKGKAVITPCWNMKDALTSNQWNTKKLQSVHFGMLDYSDLGAICLVPNHVLGQSACLSMRMQFGAKCLSCQIVVLLKYWNNIQYRCWYLMGSIQQVYRYSDTSMKEWPNHNAQFNNIEISNI